MPNATSIPTLNGDTLTDGEQQPPPPADDDFDATLAAILAEETGVAVGPPAGVESKRKLTREEKYPGTGLPIPPEVGEKVKKMFKLDPAKFTSDNLVALSEDVPREDFIKLNSRILMSMGYHSLHQMERVLELGPQILGSNDDSRVKIATGYMTAKVADSIAKMALTLKELTPTAVAPAPKEVENGGKKKYGAPPLSINGGNVQVNIGTKADAAVSGRPASSVPIIDA